MCETTIASGGATSRWIRASASCADVPAVRRAGRGVADDSVIRAAMHAGAALPSASGWPATSQAGGAAAGSGLYAGATRLTTPRPRRRAHAPDSADHRPRSSARAIAPRRTRSSPGPAARLLQRGPQARVGRYVRVGRQVGTRRARRQHARALLGTEAGIALAHEVHAALEAVAVDHDLDRVAIAERADRATGQRLGTDVADAGAGGHAGEARIGQDGHLLAPRQMSQRRGDLVDLFHAGAERAGRSAP